MTFPLGGITLDGVRFSTDPATYEPWNWEKRRSVHPAIGGLRTIQDFGVYQSDLTVKLVSGPHNPLDLPTVIALHNRFRTRGTTYAFTDWLGNAFTVFIDAFVPVPLKKGFALQVSSYTSSSRSDTSSQISLFTYSMELRVTAITTLLGVAYVGT